MPAAAEITTAPSVSVTANAPHGFGTRESAAETRRSSAAASSISSRVGETIRIGSPCMAAIRMVHLRLAAAHSQSSNQSTKSNDAGAVLSSSESAVSAIFLESLPPDAAGGLPPGAAEGVMKTAGRFPKSSGTRRPGAPLASMIAPIGRQSAVRPATSGLALRASTGCSRQPAVRAKSATPANFSRQVPNSPVRKTRMSSMRPESSPSPSQWQAPPPVALRNLWSG